MPALLSICPHEYGYMRVESKKLLKVHKSELLGSIIEQTRGRLLNRNVNCIDGLVNFRIHYFFPISNNNNNNNSTGSVDIFQQPRENLLSFPILYTPRSTRPTGECHHFRP